SWRIGTGWVAGRHLILRWRTLGVAIGDLLTWWRRKTRLEICGISWSRCFGALAERSRRIWTASRHGFAARQAGQAGPLSGRIVRVSGRLVSRVVLLMRSKMARRARSL